MDEKYLPSKRLSADHYATYRKDGYVILPGFFSEEEIAPLRIACENDPTICGSVVAVADSSGNPQEITCWEAESEDLIGVFPRIARVVNGAQQLLGEEVYHWHSKLSLKRPHSQGTWDWHQDYAFWYKDACLYPNILTCMIAVDRTDRENGCLQVLAGSQRAERIEHSLVGNAISVDPERLEEMKCRHELRYCELNSGDVAFFHGNLLHASGPNNTNYSRTILHCTYNAKSNAPYKGVNHQYKPITILPDSTIVDHQYLTVLTGHPFVRPAPGRKENKYGYKVITS